MSRAIITIALQKTLGRPPTFEEQAAFLSAMAEQAGGTRIYVPSNPADPEDGRRLAKTMKLSDLGLTWHEAFHLTRPNFSRAHFYRRKRARQESDLCSIGHDTIDRTLYKSFVYVVGFKDRAGLPVVKVGKAKVGGNRVRDITTICPYALEEVAIVAVKEPINAFNIEAQAHKRLAEHAMEGEWFSPPSIDYAVSIVEETARDLVGSEFYLEMV